MCKLKLRQKFGDTFVSLKKIWSSHEAVVTGTRPLYSRDGKHWQDASGLCAWYKRNTDGIFVFRQRHKKYISVNKQLDFAFVDLRKPLMIYQETSHGGL